MLQYVTNIFLCYQNHTIGVCFSIVVHAYRGILNFTISEMEGSGGVRAGVVLLDIYGMHKKKGLFGGVSV